MTLGTMISAYRKSLGLTQEGLAQRLDVTNQAVSKWESDQCCPDISLLPRIADLFGITLDQLFGRTPPITALVGTEEPEPSSEPDPIPEPEPREQPHRKSLFEQLFHTTMEAVQKAADQAIQEVEQFSSGFDPEGGQEMPLPPAVQPDWEDDDTLRVVLFRGRRLVAAHPARRKITFCYEGTAPINIHSDCNLSCECVSGNATARGNLSCDSVGGSAAAGGDLSCDSVGGSVAAGGDVSCDSVGGSVSAEGDVSCDTVQGDVQAGGDVDCEDVRGNVTAGGDVDCGDVSGAVRAGGNVNIG